MLERRFDVSYEFKVSRNPWMAAIEMAFVEIADYVAFVASFDMGLIGEEPAAEYGAAAEYGVAAEYGAAGVWPEQFLVDFINTTGGVFLGDILWRRLRPPREGILLPSGLRWIAMH